MAERAGEGAGEEEDRTPSEADEGGTGDGGAETTARRRTKHPEQTDLDVCSSNQRSGRCRRVPHGKAEGRRQGGRASQEGVGCFLVDMRSERIDQVMKNEAVSQAFVEKQKDAISAYRDDMNKIRDDPL
eukprot:768781-Hanusia_phi.AAC.11